MRAKGASDYISIRMVIICLCVVLVIAIYIASYIPIPLRPDFTPPPPTAAVTPTATLSQILPTATPSTPTKEPTPTPRRGGVIYSIFPIENTVGWVQSDEPGNHFNGSYLYTGLRNGTLYHGAMQFDISFIPPGSTIYLVELELTGLDDSGLKDDNSFMLNLLTKEADSQWATHNFEAIHNAQVAETLLPILHASDLGADKINKFAFQEKSPQLGLIQNRLGDKAISFRLDSLISDKEGWFAWDSGYGTGTKKNKAILRLGVIFPEVSDQLTKKETETPALIGPVVLITNTPTPGNDLTAVAVILTAIYETTATGTPTPLPNNWVLPIVVTNTPIPQNGATAYYQQRVATLMATVTGTPIPLPPNVVTATPTPTYRVVTSTPSPENVLTAAANSLQMTAQAERFGAATPLPPNWVTPIIVTSTPMPANQATVVYLQALLLTTGTPQPFANNVQTATPTPPYILLDGELPFMTATPLPPATPGPIPSVLIGKIAFKSDRTGQESIFIINPDGTGLAILTDRWPYNMAEQADIYSADGRFFAFTSDTIRYKNVEGMVPKTFVDPETGKKTEESVKGSIGFARADAPAIYWYDALYKATDQVTRFGIGIAYGGVWSPTREQLAFISTESGNDEIWVVNRDGSGLLQLTRDPYNWWDKHPTWSPDGNKIAFWSNRTGVWQIWVMDGDGKNLYTLSKTGFNDWDPVWIKYPAIPTYKQPN